MVAAHNGIHEPERAIDAGRPRVNASRTPERVRERLRQRVEAELARKWLENHERGPRAIWLRGVMRSVWRRFNRLNAPVVYPWSPSRKGTEIVHELHRIAASLTRREARGWAGRLWLGLKAAGWLPLATLASLPVLWRNGPCVREQHGQSLWEQWRDLLEAAWLHGIFPTEYYHHRVYRGSAHADKARYLSEREIVALLAACEAGAQTVRVDNVFRFLSECRTIGLAVPRTFAAFSGGTCEIFCGKDAESLPRKDLYFRPEIWGPRAEAQIWRWNAQQQRWQHRAESLGAAALIERCRMLAAGRPWLLQECLRNHPDVERFSAGGLCSVRIATGVGESGEPVALFADLRLPACDAGGEPSPAGELHAGVDVVSGVLLTAWGEFVSDGEFNSHPGTGAVMAGVALPHWHSAVELALRAHRNFRDLPFVGWEIGLSAGGAVLLEARTNWGVFHHALAIDSAFPRLCLHRLARAESARSGQGTPPSEPFETRDAESRHVAHS
jgi:hypothetical protein